jgi:uncharacterized membrane protein YesL
MNSPDVPTQTKPRWVFAPGLAWAIGLFVAFGLVIVLSLPALFEQPNWLHVCVVIVATLLALLYLLSVVYWVLHPKVRSSR